MWWCRRDDLRRILTRLNEMTDGAVDSVTVSEHDILDGMLVPAVGVSARAVNQWWFTARLSLRSFNVSF